MARKTINTVKLGIFVLTGLIVLVMLLYVIGKNQNLFGNTFQLKARFENVSGLMPGNNVRYAGINAGTVKSVDVLNDSTVEVTMLIRSKMKDFIFTNAMVNIATDGLMGSKLVNIESAKSPAPLVKEGDILQSTPSPDTDEILKMLNTTTGDIAVVAKELKYTVKRINESQAFWTLLNDETIPSYLRFSLSKIKNASENMNRMMANLDEIVFDLKQGKGTVGQLLRDTALMAGAKDAIDQIRKVGTGADSLSERINALVTTISNEIDNGDGTVNALLKDKELRNHLDNSIQNIELGTKAFNDNMEAIKHSFLFRSYFKKLEKQQTKREQAKY